MKAILFALFLLVSITSIAQHRIAIYDVQRTEGSSTTIDKVSGYIVGSYASDDRFAVIDKANTQIIREEQDRQKNEEFIDGYIVEQGAQEGYDYCYYPKYDKKEKTLSIKVYDIAKGVVASNQSVKLKNTILGTPKGLKDAIIELVEKVNSNCFEIRYEILRCIDKKKKSSAKKLLFAIGYNQRAKDDQKFEIYKMTEEKVGGKTLARKEVIGSGKIDEVQDGNFSILKVSSGGKVVMQCLDNGIQLYGAIKR